VLADPTGTTSDHRNLAVDKAAAKIFWISVVPPKICAVRRKWWLIVLYVQPPCATTPAGPAGHRTRS
jgi:hypothetical protein